MSDAKSAVLMPIKGSGKREKVELLLRNQIELQKQLFELRKEISSLRDSIRLEVEKQLGEKNLMISAALNESIIHKEILIEKGYMTRPEVNAKYSELKQKAEGCR